MPTDTTEQHCLPAVSTSFNQMEAEQLKHAIDANDLDRVRRLMTANPLLHRAPLGYGQDGPLTWVAECRVPWEPPGDTRLAIAEWMIDNGSDVHQGGDGPLMRAALRRDCIPMMDLLVSKGADVNAEWHGHSPILLAACAAVDSEVIGWLLAHGANPNYDSPTLKFRGSALDYIIGCYGPSPEWRRCIDVLLAFGAITSYSPVAVELLRGNRERLTELLQVDPASIEPELDYCRRCLRVAARMKRVAQLSDDDFAQVDRAVLAFLGLESPAVT